MPPTEELGPLCAWITRHLGGEILAVQEVQSLWSGYGRILRVQLDGAATTSAIVKHVAPPAQVRHPRGWAGAASHDRKLRSYAVELAFYSRWCSAPAAAYRTARCHAAEAVDGGFRLLLEDLDAAGYAQRRSAVTDDELLHCLRWLAAFHAAHLGRAPDELWPEGSYWHLATRRDEFAAMQDEALRAAAPKLDALLRGSRHRTIVHGDAKVANFCFAPDGVAAVDFQYVGGGCGMRDVAYLLGSCLDDAQCERHAARHLDGYFTELRRQLPASADADDIEREWRGLYAAAWADFHRFLDGWAPDHWKLTGYTRRMTREALARLQE